MLYERVTAIMDGEVTPLPGVPVLSSIGSRCSSFLLEVHAVPESREEVGWSWHNTHVAVAMTGPSVIEISGTAGSGRFVSRPGRVCVFPSGCGRTNIHHSGGDYKFTVVEIDNGRLERLFHEQAQSIHKRLTAQLYVPERRITTLVETMRAEVAAGCPSGSLYGESLSLALAAYLSSRYAVSGDHSEAVAYRFSHKQIQRLLDYIHAHLGSDYSLVELARIAHLSPRHFSRLFRNTFGATPYRYVVSERVNQAGRLLAEGRLSIVEIADRTGFASQSHFTDVFRRSTGVSPRRYRQTH